MRKAFAEEITNYAREIRNIVLLSGDIGNKMFDEFKEIAPNRFFNCGIAESNMMSVASGMALSGLKPVIYTITPFTTLRCLEQIKIGAAYHDAPVIIIGTGSGLSYAELGATHHSLDDIAILRSIPNIKILAPCDSNELRAFLKQSIDSKGPTYIRIGKKGEPIITNSSNIPRIGEANILCEGSDNLVIGIGPILSEAIVAAKKTLENGKSTCVISMGSIKPLDEKILFKMSERNFKKWIVLEEHSKIGGLSSAILEWKEDNDMHTPKIKRFGSKDEFLHNLGKQDYLRRVIGLDSDSIFRELNND